jgi:hypothetical protein
LLVKKRQQVSSEGETVMADDNIDNAQADDQLGPNLALASLDVMVGTCGT